MTKNVHKATDKAFKYPCLDQAGWCSDDKLWQKFAARRVYTIETISTTHNMGSQYYSSFTTYHFNITPKFILQFRL